MRKLIEQIFKFGLVGILCFVIDYGLMIFITEVIRVNYLISSGISFTVSVIVNYLLSLKFVFVTNADNNKFIEFIVFIILSIIGLVINQMLMWVCVDKWNIYYMISKIGVTAVVMAVSYTHLDVYKRQVEWPIRILSCPATVQCRDSTLMSLNAGRERSTRCV